MSSLPLIASCDGCGACCRERSVPPFSGVEDEEFLALPMELQDTIRELLGDATRVDKLNSSCAWLDRESSLCRHYEHRPSACREFERESFYCLTFRRRRGLPTA